MTLLSSIFFFGAYADHTNGEPAWIVRNMIIFGMIIYSAALADTKKGT